VLTKPPDTARVVARVDRAQLDVAYAEVLSTACTAEVQHKLLTLLKVIQTECGDLGGSSGGGNVGGMLSDRTFLVKAVKLLKAEAYLRGR
jgi:hypothetical protein